MDDLFKGTAAPMSAAAMEAAAARLRCPLAAVRAVIEVESKGGFQPDGRPRILFERHYFHRLTSGRHDVSHPDLSQPVWGGYGKAQRQYDRLLAAMALDRDAALRSCSWGAFQIMGDNFRAAGFATVEDFVTAMVAGEDAQLAAFVHFVIDQGLDDALRRQDWAGFARRYNGPAYRANRYDARLAAAYVRHAGGAAGARAGRRERALPLLRHGDRGAAVRLLQALLGLDADGIFGGATRAAVIALQNEGGLTADAVVGPQSWALLLDRMARR